MHLIIEGIDRLGKDTVISTIQNRLGYRLVLHYQKPTHLVYYKHSQNALREYQLASFRTMLSVLRDTQHTPIICNRAHLGEMVYAPRYRNYSGDYVLELEKQFSINTWRNIRLILLTEDFTRSRHFIDDGKSLGAPSQRQSEQSDFTRAFHASAIQDKRIICVTDPVTGGYRIPAQIADDVLLELNE